jgi:hypothetical protein
MDVYAPSTKLTTDNLFECVPRKVLALIYCSFFSHQFILKQKGAGKPVDPANTSMKHFEYYPFLTPRFEQMVFFPDLLNLYYFPVAFVCSRYHQSLAQVLDLLLEVTLSKRIIALGKYDGKQLAADFQRMTSCNAKLLKEVKSLGPESSLLLVTMLLHFKTAFDNGYKQDALIDTLKLVAHIEKRFEAFDMSVPLFRVRRQQIVFPDFNLLNKAGSRLEELLERPYFNRKKIEWSEPGFDTVLKTYYRFAKDAGSQQGYLLKAEGMEVIASHWKRYFDTWELIRSVKTALINGTPV